MQTIDVHDLPEPVAKATEAMVETLRQTTTDHEHRDESVIEAWLKRARGAAVAGVTTDAIMAATRGEQ